MIPRILHFVWVGGKPLPKRYETNIETWRTHHPSWDLRLWKEVPGDVDWRWVTLCENRPTQIADLLRVEMVYRHGGVYADADSFPVRPIDSVIDGLDSFLVRNCFGDIDNHVFGATKNHPWLAHVLRKVHTHYFPNDRIGLVGANLFVRTAPLSYPKSRLFDFGILNASPSAPLRPETVAVHAEDRSWKKTRR